MITDEVTIHSNAAYGFGSKVEDSNVYETVPPLGSTFPQEITEEDLNPAVGKDVKKVRVNCYAIVTILALVMAVLSLIVALVGVSYAPIELNNQQGRLSSSNQEVESQINNVKQQIRLLNTQLDVQSEKLNHSNQQIQILFQADRNIIARLQLGTISYPASSCNDITQYKPSGEYWIATNSTSSPVQVYCDMNRTSCSCNTTGGWMRVANLDMTDSNQNCPDGFRLVNRTEPPLRTCGRPGPGCVSITYPTYGVEYSRACGRVIGYQDKSTDAFDEYFLNRAASIDDNYVDGVSLTHGKLPRQHIWTFASALDETRSTPLVCPCTRADLTYSGALPPFIGQDYFCETGSRQTFSDIFYPDDPLWDGQGCGGTSTCCEFNKPPWFCKQLPQPTTDSIELRLCGDYDFLIEDSPIEIVEIYVHAVN